MFSGIVEMMGRITHWIFEHDCKHFTITPAHPMADLSIGDSIAVNGTCLTITRKTNTTFNVTAVPETLRLTNLDTLAINQAVNLERSLLATGRNHGHYVQGHVDAMGQILEIRMPVAHDFLNHVPEDHHTAILVKISMPSGLAKYIVNKGPISLDGMSITVIEATPDWFTVTFIPHTQAVTISQYYSVGDWINIEVDILGKYIEKFLEAHTHAIRHS